jgi:nicotinate-nucleotide pyrophosphorylase (carboxylating)
MARRADRRAGGADPAAALARRALAEDRAARDRTTRALLPRGVAAEGRVVAQASGVVSGMSVVRAIARASHLTVVAAWPDGGRVDRGTVVVRLRGDARRLLAAERTLLNVLMHASGVATATAAAVRAAGAGRRPLEVWATRKTLPGLRDVEKASVVHGGGRPHRRDLAAGLLVKNNHLALVPLERAVRRARAAARPGERVEVEVRSAAEALRAARSGADALLIDNAPPARARAIVRSLEHARLRRRVWVELSGGITPATVGRYRDVGADAVSVGALTHSAAALPFHLELRAAGLRARAS